MTRAGPTEHRPMQPELLTLTPFLPASPAAFNRDFAYAQISFASASLQHLRPSAFRLVQKNMCWR